MRPESLAASSVGSPAARGLGVAVIRLAERTQGPGTSHGEHVQQDVGALYRNGDDEEADGRAQGAPDEHLGHGLVDRSLPQYPAPPT